MFVIRYVLVGASAVVVTTALFWMMHLLITHGLDDEREEVPPLRNIDVVRLKTEAAAEEEVIELPDKVTPQEAPEAPELDLPQSDLNSSGGLQINIEAPKVTESVEIKISEGPKLQQAVSDSDAVPMVRVNPMFPPRAAQQRIEGWVRVSFSISKTGSVKNAKVLASEPPGIFDEAAIKAIRKWKYKAKIVDGKRVERHGITVKLAFDLDDL